MKGASCTSRIIRLGVRFTSSSIGHEVVDGKPAKSIFQVTAVNTNAGVEAVFAIEKGQQVGISRLVLAIVDDIGIDREALKLGKKAESSLKSVNALYFFAEPKAEGDINLPFDPAQLRCRF